MLSRQQLRIAAFSTAVIAFAATGGSALAQKKYDTGATDTEIKIGNIMPYSGPASAYGVIGKTEEAYFKKINAEGGINGRKINFISYDDGYSPPKAVEQARKLVESDEVLLIFNPLGTPSNSAIQKYMNAKKVPQLFVATGATKWNDPKNFPVDHGLAAQLPERSAHLREVSDEGEARRQDRHALSERRFRQRLPQGPEGRARRQGLDDIAEESYETSEPTIDDHIVKLKASGADVFLSITTPKFAAQAIKKLAEIEWKPLHIVTNVSASVGGVMKPAGFENAQGILSAAYAKDGADPQWDNDPGMKKFYAFLEKYFPEANKLDGSVVYGYGAAQTMVKVLEMCGDNLTRENIMKQAASLKDFTPDTLLPGVKINTTATDFAPIEQLQMMRFKGEKWDLFGDIISGELSN